MTTDLPSTTTEREDRLAATDHRVPWTTHLLAGTFYAVGTFGFLGGIPIGGGLSLGIGVLVLAVGMIIASVSQRKHHGHIPFGSGFGFRPHSLLAAWIAAGPLAFHLTLPDATPLSVITLISLLLGTACYTVLRLEEAELTARSCPEPDGTR